MLRLFAVTVLLVSLAACGDRDTEDRSTSVSLNVGGEDGAMTLNADGDGRVTLDTPMFGGSITLPKFSLDADSVDLNGVHLYPGSTVTALNIDAADDRSKDDRHVVVRFESPATSDAVRDWFKSRLGDAGYTLDVDGGGLRGTTEEGKPFRLQLSSAGEGRTQGIITITDTD